MVTLLYRETATRVDLDDVERLCTLFNCKIGDLFELVESKNPKPRKSG